MENEVVIHVRAEDDTAAGFAKARASAKRHGEQIEQDLKASGKKAGAGLADGIGQGFDAGSGSILGKVGELGDGAKGILGDAGENAGRGLGQGVSDGFDAHAPDILSGATTLGADIADEMSKAGKRAGENLGDGISEGMKGKSGGGDDDGGGLIPGAGKKGFAAGKKAGAGFVSGLGTMLSGVSEDPRVLGALALVGVAASPLIGGALGAAVIGGAAGVGIVGGFAAAATDPRVKASAISLGQVVTNDLKTASKAFVPSAIAAIGQVRDAWKGLTPTIESVFAQSAGLVKPLLDGVIEGVEAIADGIDNALGGAGPVVESFGEAFARIGAALGDVLTMLSDDGDTAASAIDFLSGAIEGAILALGYFAEASMVVIDAVRPLFGLIADGINWIDEWGNKLFGAGEGSDELGGKQGDLFTKLGDTTRAIDDQVGSLQTLADEMKEQTDPLFAMMKAQRDVEKAQTDYNKALKEHGPKSAEAKEALAKLGEAATDMATAAAAASRDGLDVVTPAMREMWKQAGLSKRQMDALEQALKDAKRAASNWEGTFHQTYITNYKTMGLKSPNPGQQGYASGGIVGAATGGVHSGMRLVGEHGPELVELPAGTRVSSNADTVNKLAPQTRTGGGASAYGAASQMVMSFDPSGLNKLARAIMEMLRAEVRDQGGSVQTVLGVSGVG